MAHNLNRRSWLAGAGALAAASMAGPGRAQDATHLPKLNQLGFKPGAAKHFAVTLASAESPPDPGSLVFTGRLASFQPAVSGLKPIPFTVESDTGTLIFTGMTGAPADLRAAAGEYAATGDVSALTRPGLYRVRCGDQLSFPFRIGGDVYDSLLHDAARTFYIIRANAALLDPVTGLSHAAGHPADRHIMVNGEVRDLTGGWYNAGDFGKWTHMAAMACSEMMWLCELRPAAAGLKLDMPALWALPDLLQQARWGLEWLLKMQNADGSVLHKVDTQPNFAWGKAPADDPNPRAARGASSIDAGVFAAVMAQAARVYAGYDPAFAGRCRAVALRAWTWLQAHPSVLHDDPYYTDSDPRQEAAWAGAEVAVLTGDKDLAARTWASYAALATEEPDGLLPFFWPSPQVLGAMTLARYGPAPVRDAAIHALARAAAVIAAEQAGDPYGFSANPGRYTWGSVEMALDKAVVCLFAAEVTGEAAPRATAQRTLDYVLGCNALNLSFVTGHGSHSVEHPYNWTWRTQKKLMPGWPSGGPNGQLAGVDPLLAAVISRGTPPAKCFIDACEDNGSWGCNEGQVSETAALVLTAGLLAL